MHTIGMRASHAARRHATKGTSKNKSSLSCAKDTLCSPLLSRSQSLVPLAAQHSGTKRLPAGAKNLVMRPRFSTNRPENAIPVEFVAALIRLRSDASLRFFPGATSNGFIFGSRAHAIILNFSYEYGRREFGCRVQGEGCRFPHKTAGQPPPPLSVNQA